MNPQKGLVCSLTGEHATFEDECKDFKIDEKEAALENEKIAAAETQEKEPVQIIEELDPHAISRLRESQDYLYAILGGMATALICAFLWAAITVATNYQIGFMAIGVGLAVGFAVRYFGAGVDKPFGVIGAISALIGCFLGNLFTQVWFIAEYQSLSFMNAFKLLDLTSMITIVTETFSGIDLVFYGIAAYEGYRFAFRSISASEISKLNSTPDYIPVPANQQYRLPAVIGTFIFLSIAYFSLSGTVSGIQKYYYENGNIMSEGNLIDGKLNGTWKYYDEAGNLSLAGDFKDDVEEGEWTWYANNKITKKGSYKNGIPDGVWLKFYDNGTLMDSGNFLNARMEGHWVYKYPNGKISSEGEMNMNHTRGLWKNYYENGQIANEIEYDEEGKAYITSLWDKNGNQLIHNGNGTFLTYHFNGNISEEGKVLNGKKTGEWKMYYPDGKIRLTGSFDQNDILVVNDYFDENNYQIVKNGNGEINHYQISDGAFEEGLFVNGYKEGLWHTYYSFTGALMAESNYKDGKLEGIFKTYYESGVNQTDGYFQNNERNGIWSWYFENGQLETTINYSEGKKEGVQDFYNELGIKVRTEEYIQGELRM
ncbi:MAG: toxin-antitoxin system YwqK family antitoxin [Candidatus Cyclobacteriaceae bacterium M2_1C_046]